MGWATGCQHISLIVEEIQQSIDVPTCCRVAHAPGEEKTTFVDAVARQNVLRTVRQILGASRAIHDLISQGRVAVVDAMCDIRSGKIEILTVVPEGQPAAYAVTPIQ